MKEGEQGVDGVDGVSYGLVRSPSPTPGDAEEPIMTWGDIEGTPMILGEQLCLTLAMMLGVVA